MNAKIRVLVVDDSVFYRTVIAKGLEVHPSIQVVGVASSAYEARDKILQLKPDVMTLDVEMPKMNGIEFLKILMPQRPMPVVVVSAVNGIVFEALKAGAVDFVEKPSSGGSATRNFTDDLAAKIVVASTAQLRGAYARPGMQAAPLGAQPPVMPMGTGAVSTSGIIAIGASTGGTEATSQILKQLPANMPPIVVTQHMPPVFTRMYAQRLDGECRLSVKEAADNDVVSPGKVYIAPGGDQQMRVVKRGSQMVIRCETGEKVNGHCPSVDVLFDSVAQFADKNTVGIILTGMGMDGAKGLLKLKERGAYTMGQDEKTCVVYGMPMMAYKLGGVMTQLPLGNIAPALVRHLAQRR